MLLAGCCSARSTRCALPSVVVGRWSSADRRPAGHGEIDLAEALARCLLAFKRVSFTSDLLPADLTGLNVFNPAEASFVPAWAAVHPGVAGR